MGVHTDRCVHSPSDARFNLHKQVKINTAINCRAVGNPAGKLEIGIARKPTARISCSGARKKCRARLDVRTLARHPSPPRSVDAGTTSVISTENPLADEQPMQPKSAKETRQVVSAIYIQWLLSNKCRPVGAR